MTQITLQISEPLAQQLADTAMEQKKSIEQIAVESLESSFQGKSRKGSPAAILEVLRSLPPLDSEMMDELERIIESGHSPAINKGIFDEGDS